MANIQKRNDSMLDYRLTDILEMEYSTNEKHLKLVKSKLLSSPVRNHQLELLSTFTLEDKLVVIQRGITRRLKKLFLLNSKRKSFQIVSLSDTKAVEKGED